MKQNKFINIPFKESGRSFKGCDCYGIIYLYYKHQLGIEIQEMLDINENTKFDIEVIKKQGVKFKKMDHNIIQKNDIGVFTNQNNTIHCGVFIDSGHLLHLTQRLNSVIENFHNSFWKKKMVGLFRHENFL